MERRKFIRTLGAGAVAGTGLTGCNLAGVGTGPGGSGKTREWRMVTTWPKDFPGLGTAANRLGELITQMSGGRINVTVHGWGELVDAFGIFDFVGNGEAELGHGASYYWNDKTQAAQFFAAVPFGMNAQEMNAWLYRGGGLDLWKEVYEPFGLHPMAAGNTGVQMGGWFNREINSIQDLRGLRMRIPGLGGEVLNRAGGEAVNLPGGEILSALRSGRINATEWVGPYNDLAFGLHEAAEYYYYPGWHEPGTTIECFVNREALESLPEDLQHVVTNAARVANQDMLADLTSRNLQALETLVSKHNVKLQKFPHDVLERLKELSEEVVAEVAQGDDLTGRVHESFMGFRQNVMSWHQISERAFLNARDRG